MRAECDERLPCSTVMISGWADGQDCGRPSTKWWYDPIYPRVVARCDGHNPGVTLGLWNEISREEFLVFEVLLS
jgi:hypothetical protein